MIKLNRIDHFVMRVADVDTTCEKAHLAQFIPSIFAILTAISSKYRIIEMTPNMSLQLTL